MSRIKRKFIRFGTGTEDVNAQVVPANFTPSNYTPAQVSSEGTDKISAHLKGIDNTFGSLTPDTVVSISSNVTLSAFTINLVNTSAARNLTLPSSPSSGDKIIIKDITGSANVNNITLVRAASESIEGVAANYTIDVIRASFTLICDGTDWWFI